ncbi:hypothetical protein CDEE_0177 [Candidatus Kinetoplastibacterium crithidii TCC036E]|uniref:Uncharacterized protein n=1 Tax=Candidatus Kinetoplastidibacterium crithidiae TCC036E TaxID=1208918 RepID=M1LV79_9PROT|nr:hypothetical protein CDEE_0177 [Candidatus Kinetoplastibacterium crithidii TCC036E]
MMHERINGEAFYKFLESLFLAKFNPNLLFYNNIRDQNW